MLGAVHVQIERRRRVGFAEFGCQADHIVGRAVDGIEQVVDVEYGVALLAERCGRQGILCRHERRIGHALDMAIVIESAGNLPGELLRELPVHPGLIPVQPFAARAVQRRRLDILDWKYSRRRKGFEAAEMRRQADNGSLQAQVVAPDQCGGCQEGIAEPAAREIKPIRRANRDIGPIETYSAAGIVVAEILVFGARITAGSG